MTSKYAVEFAVPDEFPELLKEFTREVLRAVTYEEISGREDEIYSFAVQHFTKLAKGRTARFNRRKIERAALEMCQNADVDGSGELDFDEVQEIFRKIGEDLGLSSSKHVGEITAAVMRSADLNGDGLLTYEEFLPVAMDIVESLFHKFSRQQNAVAESAQVSSEKIFETRTRHTAARMKAEGALVRGMSEAELAKLISKVFKQADRNGSGSLQPSELKQCLKEAGLGLSNEEISYAVQQADVDHDGQVDFEEFAPLCYEMLIELMARQIVAEEDKKNASIENRERAEKLIGSMGRETLEKTLSQMFAAADTDRNGHLDAEELVNALTTMKLGLTSSDINQILSRVMTTADGKLRYQQFAPLAYELLTAQLQRDISDEDSLREEAERRLFKGKSPAEVEEMVKRVFNSADKQGRGFLSPEELYVCMVSSGLGLTHDEIMDVIKATDTDQNEMIDLGEFTPVCYELALEVAMREIKAQKRAEEEGADDSRRKRAEDYLMQQMSREELQSTLTAIFEKADKDGSGHLDREEFASCLQDTALGFSPDQIGFVINETDKNKDGSIDFQEFAPVCFDMLVTMIAREMEDE